MEAFIVYGRNDTRKRKNRKGNKTSINTTEVHKYHSMPK